MSATNCAKCCKSCVHWRQHLAPKYVGASADLGDHGACARHAPMAGPVMHPSTYAGHICGDHEWRESPWGVRIGEIADIMDEVLMFWNSDVGDEERMRKLSVAASQARWVRENIGRPFP